MEGGTGHVAAVAIRQDLPLVAYSIDNDANVYVVAEYEERGVARDGRHMSAALVTDAEIRNAKFWLSRIFADYNNEIPRRIHSRDHGQQYRLGSAPPFAPEFISYIGRLNCKDPHCKSSAKTSRSTLRPRSTRRSTQTSARGSPVHSASCGVPHRSSSTCCTWPSFEVRLVSRSRMR